MKKKAVTDFLKYLSDIDRRRLYYLKDNIDDFVPWLIAYITSVYLAFNRDCGNISDSQYFNISQDLDLWTIGEETSWKI